MPSWKKPTPEQVERASLALNRPETTAFFFGKLNNPLWIGPLRDLGYFKSPPPEQREGDSLSFPVWPAARYLVRMAEYGPEEARAAVAAILEATPTNNHVVHLSYVELALAAPVTVAVDLARVERKWVQGQPWLFALLPEKLGDLVAHLALGGCKNEATKLAHRLLAISGATVGRTGDRVKARFDGWHYGEVLKRVLPAMQKVDALWAIRFLCNLLFECAKHEAGSGESIGWRPAIEQSDQNWNVHDVADQLVDATRDVCESAVRSGAVTLTAVLGELAKRRRQGIFKRLELHLVRVFKDQATAALQQELLDTSHLHSLSLRHEYSLLMQEGFALLTPSQKEAVLQAITAGPSAQHWDLSNADDRSEFERYSRTWKRDRLAMIRDAIPADWKAVYDGLVEELGEPAHPAFVTSSAMWVGPQSPKTGEELAAMSLDALVEYLVVWRPVRDFMAPSTEGLGRVLTDVVAKDPARFLEGEAKLRRLHPAYIRSIVSGFANALKAGGPLDTGRLMTFVGWCVSQSSMPYSLPGDFTDKDWGWTRNAVLDVVTAGMQGEPEFPISAREAVWNALSPLLEDRNPTQEEERADSDSLEPGDVALNTVRGSAMLALVQYALWVRRWQEKHPDQARLLAAGFGELPEVREALDAHLDPSREPSLAVRSVYGRWFPWLVMLDRAWARAAAQRIFPLASEEEHRRDAAWLTYLSHNRPYSDVVEMLHGQYVFAAERIGSKSRIRVRSWRPPEQALGQHLVAMYARGWIALDDPALLLFFERADVETRVKVLASVGQDLNRPDPDESRGGEAPTAAVLPDVITRLKALWEARLTAENRDKRESEAFGWWFACGAFDEGWAWQHLVAAVQEVDRVEGLLFLAKRLAKLAPSAPRDGIKVLKALTANPTKPWPVFELKDAIRPVLSAALAADEETRQTAVHVLNRLGERGFTEYGDLLARS